MAEKKETTSSGTYRLDKKAGEVTVELDGVWATESLGDIARDFLSEMGSVKATNVTLRLGGIDRLDTAGALLINKAILCLEGGKSRLTIHNDNDNYARLMDAAQPVPDDRKPPSPPPLPVRLVNTLGKTLVDSGHSSVSLISFMGQFLVTLGHQIVQPHKVRWTSLFFFMEQAGIKAIPIVSLLAFLIGMVVAYMGMNELARFGAQFFSIKLLEVTILREMGILVTAIVVAGRSTSSFTAQIGSMVANEEVAAIRSMGLDPTVLLTIPRMVALIVTFPLLVFIANVVAIFGGGVAICLGSDITPHNFLMQFSSGANVNNLIVGLIKTPFCALAIGLVGCFHGFRATTSAESVGFLTTTSVVQAIFLVIVIDAIFAIFFATVGI